MSSTERSRKRRARLLAARPVVAPASSEALEQARREIARLEGELERARAAAEAKPKAPRPVMPETEAVARLTRQLRERTAHLNAVSGNGKVRKVVDEV